MIRKAERKDLPDILNIYNDAILNTTLYILIIHKVLMNEKHGSKQKCLHTNLYLYLK